jgi:hypothetical protein
VNSKEAAGVADISAASVLFMGRKIGMSNDLVIQ